MTLWRDLTYRMAVNAQTIEQQIVQDTMSVGSQILQQHLTQETMSPLEQQNLTPDQKLDLVLNTTRATQEEVTSIRTDMTKLTTDFTTLQESLSTIGTLQQENSAIKQQLSSTQGKLVKLEGELKTLQSRVIENESKQMENVLIFYNVPEEANETPESTKKRIYKLLAKDISMPPDLIFSTENPAGEIRIDYANRLGKTNTDPDTHRPIYVKFVTRTGKQIIQKKAYTDKLRSLPSKVRISDQHPSEVRERRSAQIDKLIELRDQYSETDTSVTLIKDKLYVDKRPIGFSTSVFQKNLLPETSPLTIHSQSLYHTSSYTKNGSTFQGHSAIVQNVEQASAARSSLFQIPDLAKAQHLIYAYKITKNNGETIIGNSDDGEIAASKLILKKIEEKNITNIFVCVSRIKKGGNIGKKRFGLVEQCAEEALSINLNHQDPSSLYFSL